MTILRGADPRSCPRAIGQDRIVLPFANGERPPAALP